MNREIERKYLVTGEFKNLSYKSYRIVQGYLSSVPERVVRVRIKGDKAYITIKGPAEHNGLSRFEWEKEITIADAEALLPLCEPGTIDKTRYLVKNGAHIVEVDEFYGENQGLVVAEVELISIDDIFDKPEWLGEEVTGDDRYYNSNLVKRPYTIW
ncbi:MAG: CYTH domain-containing protein [Bacteroidales bacterium]